MEQLTTNGHKVWLKKKLREYKIDNEYLLGLAIIVERAVYDEQLKHNRFAHRRPFYMLRREGKPTRAWLYIAELALFCKYRGYNPAEYVRSVCSMPSVRRHIFYDKPQIPISFISPSTRIGASHLRKREDHFLRHQYKDAY